MPFALNFAWQDSRSARRRLLLFVSAMALGVAALVAIQSFGDSLSAAVAEEAKALASADLNVYAVRPLTPAEEALTDSLARATGAETAEQWVFSSMAYFPESGGSRLVQTRATDGPFPFYGEVVTTPAGQNEVYQQQGEALVDASLMLQFEAEVGDSVRVGERTYRIAGRVEEAAGEPGIGAFVAPRVYVPLAGLDSTLVGFGSRVERNTYFRLPDGADAEAVFASIRPTLTQMNLRGWTAGGVQSDWNNALGDLSRFLALVGFVALLLGGVGVASAVTVYVRQKADTVATLRCLGARAGQALRAYVAQAAALGLAASVAGAALGLAVQTLLPRVLGPFLPVEVPFAVSWPAVLTGIAVGLAVALGFALLPLLRVRRIPPLMAIRSDAAAEGGRDPLRWLVAAVLAVGVGLFAWAQTGDARAAVGFPVGVAAALGLLALVARATMWAVRRLAPRGIPYVWRQGLANLYRPGNQTLILLLTLGLGTFLILTLYLVQFSLLDRLALPGGDDDRPGMILFDIQPEQVAEVEAAIRAEGAPVLDRVSVVTMRLAAIEGRPAAAIRADSASQIDDWALRREYRSTYRASLTDTEELTAGTFTGQYDGDGSVPVSLSTDIAEELNVGVGDRLTWDVGGVPVESVVGSLRLVDWGQVQPNFFAVFPQGPLDRAPQFNIVLTRTEGPEAAAQLQRSIVRAFPNVSVVDVRLVLGLIEGVLGRVGFVLQFMALFSIATGLVVLAGAVLIARLQRIEESVLLRTLGASRRQVRRILVAEYALLGFLGALVGVVLAVGGAWALAAFVFDAPFVPSWGALALALVVVPLLTVIVGLSGSRGVLGRPPLEVLRTAG